MALQVLAVGKGGLEGTSTLSLGLTEGLALDLEVGSMY